MAIKKTEIRLDKKDYLRAILTDTSPSDAPIVYSNDGLYINSKIAKLQYDNQNMSINLMLYSKIVDPKLDRSLNDADKAKKANSQSHPLKYKIYKSIFKTRNLSLIHPRSQVNYARVYSENADILLNSLCRSKYSIRYPKRIASSIFVKDSRPLSKYKEVDIDTIQDELSKRHASSYFAYGGYHRYYKFFSSKKFMAAEKKFNVMCTLDVANCFDSVYTHTVAWALKHKEYVKGTLKETAQFGTLLDRVMQRSNSNETNGIPVGPEFSRIFAEIIFQDIDDKIYLDIIRRLKYEHETDYAIYRYVDDIIIFAVNDVVLENVIEAVRDGLSEYRFYFAEKKIRKYYRPIYTEISRSIDNVKNVVAEIERIIFGRQTYGKKIDGKINKVRSRWHFTRHIINLVKGVQSENSENVKATTGYIISALVSRILLIVESHYSLCQHNNDGQIEAAIQSLVDIILHFYSVLPTTSASYSMAKAILVSDDYFGKHNREYQTVFRTIIVKFIDDTLVSSINNSSNLSHSKIEDLNLINSISSFNAPFTIQPDSLLKLFCKNEKLNYFEIVCLLHYIKNDMRYESIKLKVLSNIHKKLSDISILSSCSESSHLFLDVLTCPYIDKTDKSILLKKFLLSNFQSSAYTDVQIDSFIDELSQDNWFVRWTDLNLLNALERKELMRPY